MRLIRHVSAAALCCAFLTWAAPAAAQTPGPSGPLVLEPLNNGFVIAPDVKVTKINGNVETLAGGYAGRVHDQHLLVGGGGYWLASGTDGRELGYGGFVAGWILRPDSAVSFTAKALAGLGWLSELSTPLPMGAPFVYGDPVRVDRFPPTPVRYHLNRPFFVAEPEFDVQLKINPHLRVTAGASYRLVHLERGLDELARGPSGSVSVQFKFGK